MKNLNHWRIKQSEAYKTYIKTSAVGLEFGLAIAIGALIGYFVDKYFLSAPYALIFGVVVGSIAAAKRLWMFVNKYLEENKDDNEK